jgi:hypothetical protein
MQIDHIFIRARAGAPEAEQLLALGWAEGSSNHHPGQGTENRRFFFENIFIELLWIADHDEIQGEQTRRTMLFERLSMEQASPFGVCFRPEGDGDEAPFPHWEYTPAYLPPGLKIDIGMDAPLTEPLWFFLASASAPAAYPFERQEPLYHPLELNRISAITLTMPGAEHLSEAATAARGTGQVRFVAGSEHLMEVIFDDHRQGGTHDLRPHLPLLVRY